MNIFIEAVKAAQEDAIARFPEESVGLVVNGQYIPVENVSPKPREFFETEEDTWLRYGKVEAVIHSHTNGKDYPNRIDMQHQMDTDVPWAIIVCNGEQASDPIWWGDSLPMAPLVGRGFRHGIHDCFAAIRDWFTVEKKILLPNCPRDWGWWDEDDVNLYEKNFEAWGFREINKKEVQEGDCFLAKLHSDTPNHAAVYAGKGLIYHHPGSTLSKPVDLSKLSTTDVLGRWMDSGVISHWVRFDEKNLPSR